MTCLQIVNDNNVTAPELRAVLQLPLVRITTSCSIINMFQQLAISTVTNIYSIFLSATSAEQFLPKFNFTQKLINFPAKTS